MQQVHVALLLRERRLGITHQYENSCGACAWEGGVVSRPDSPELPCQLFERAALRRAWCRLVPSGMRWTPALTLCAPALLQEQAHGTADCEVVRELCAVAAVYAASERDPNEQGLRAAWRCLTFRG